MSLAEVVYSRSIQAPECFQEACGFVNVAVPKAPDAQCAAATGELHPGDFRYTLRLPSSNLKDGSGASITGHLGEAHMKKLINDPGDAMRESLAGFAEAHAEILKVCFD